MKRKRPFVLVGTLAAGLSGCSADPGAPLIPLRERPATVLPSEASHTADDGFPNVLSDPVAVAGAPRNGTEIEAGKSALAARGRTAQTRTAGLAQGSFAAELSRRGATHVDEARLRIGAAERLEPAAARPTDPDDVRRRIAAGQTRVDDAGASPDAPTATAESVDPDAPSPRAVGVAPFRGAPVAPAR